MHGQVAHHLEAGRVSAHDLLAGEGDGRVIRDVEEAVRAPQMVVANSDSGIDGRGIQGDVDLSRSVVLPLEPAVFDGDGPPNLGHHVADRKLRDAVI